MLSILTIGAMNNIFHILPFVASLEIELERDKRERDARERDMRERELREMELREKMKQELEMKPPGMCHLVNSPLVLFWGDRSILLHLDYVTYRRRFNFQR